MFLTMMKEIRERVTDLVFKARLAPPQQQQPQRPAQRPAQRPQNAPVGNIVGSSIMGPGFSVGGNPPARPVQPPKPSGEGAGS